MFRNRTYLTPLWDKLTQRLKAQYSTETFIHMKTGTQIEVSGTDHNLEFTDISSSCVLEHLSLELLKKDFISPVKNVDIDDHILIRPSSPHISIYLSR